MNRLMADSLCLQQRCGAEVFLCRGFVQNYIQYSLFKIGYRDNNFVF